VVGEKRRGSPPLEYYFDHCSGSVSDHGLRHSETIQWTQSSETVADIVMQYGDGPRRLSL